MLERPQPPKPPGPPRGKLVCKEVAEDLLALMRDELSPLRAESVRSHLTSCHECREAALELEIAGRSFSKLPDIEPPVDLITRTLNRVRLSQSSQSVKPVVAAASPSQPQPPAPPGEDDLDRPGVLFRPIENRVARLVVAALFLLMAIAFSVPSIAEALGKAQQRLMGREITEKLDEATQNFLMRFFL
jgi:anti-sigma factor RsiW